MVDTQKQINDRVRADITAFISEVKGEYDTRFTSLAGEKEAKDLALELPNKRLQTRAIRPFFVYTMHQYLLDCVRKFQPYALPRAGAAIDDEQIVQLGLIYEIIICIQYYHNQILDKKFGVTTEAKTEDNLKAATELKRLLYEYIENTFKGSTKKTIKKYVNRTLLYVDIGQWMQINYNTYAKLIASPKREENAIPQSFAAPINNFIQRTNTNAIDADFTYLTAKEIFEDREKLIERNVLEAMQFDASLKKADIGEAINDFINLQPMKLVLDSLKEEYQQQYSFIEGYFKRTFLTCGTLFISAVETLINLMQVEGKLKDDTLKFVKVFGTMRQLVNDVTDCIPSDRHPGTLAKFPTDAFADLKTDNITLPLVVFGAKDKDSLEQMGYLIKEEVDLEIEKSVYYSMINDHVLYKTMSIGKIIKKNSSAYLFAEKTNDSKGVIKGTKHLFYMMDMVDNNGLYKIICDTNNKLYRQYSKRRKPGFLKMLEEETFGFVEEYKRGNYSSNKQLLIMAA